MPRDLWVNRDTYVVVARFDNNHLKVAVHKAGNNPIACLYDIDGNSKESIAQIAVSFVKRALGMQDDQ